MSVLKEGAGKRSWFLPFLLKRFPCLCLLVLSLPSWGQIQVDPLPDQSRAKRLSPQEVRPWSGGELPKIRPPEGMSDDAVRLLRAEAANDDPNALWKLAAIAASDMDAFLFVQRAAELGSTEAEHELAAMYAQGRGTAVDGNKAMTLWREASRKGHREAQCELGILLLRRASPAEQLEGIEWLQKSSDAGLSRSALNLAKVFATGEFGVPIDEARAEALLKPYALKDDSECQFALASLYAQGTTFKDHRELALHWLKRAAELGHSEASRVLGTLNAPVSDPQARP